MTVSFKRRHEIAQEAKEFAEAYKLAVVYARAGDTEMANFFLNSVKLNRSSPEEKAWIIEQAQKRMYELLARDHERRQQGLPPSETKKPSLH